MTTNFANPGKHELSSLLQFRVAQLRERVEHFDDVLAGPAFAHVGKDGLDEGTFGEFLYGLGLCFCHFVFSILVSGIGSNAAAP